MPGYSVRIFVPSGEPEGLRIVEKSNWTGQGLVFPRSLFSEIRDREELQRAGVYLLWSADEAQLYIGQADRLQPRLQNQLRNKDWWSVCITFSADSLNKAHVHYLESRLVDLAAEAQRCKLDNANVPKPPSLGEADTQDCELFLADILLTLPVLGLTFFEKPPEASQEQAELYLWAGGLKVKAQGYDTPAGFVIREGSQAATSQARSIAPNLVALRQQFRETGVLLKDGDQSFRFSRDVLLPSPSAASGVVLGRRSNGLIEWKDAEGRTLRELQSNFP